MNVLGIFAHPDDETIAAGATLAKHSKAGDIVTVRTFTDGVSSRGRRTGEASKRRVEHLAALDALGAHFGDCPSYGDQELDTVPLLQLAKFVESSIIIDKPDVIYTHWPHDLNQDHRAVAEAVMIATRPAVGSSVGRVLACEVRESTSQVFGTRPAFVPNVYVEADGGEALQAKLKALRCYESEERVSPHPRAWDSVQFQMTTRGAEAGMRSAEAFVLIRELVK